MTNVRHRLDVTNGNTMAARLLRDQRRGSCRDRHVPPGDPRGLLGVPGDRWVHPCRPDEGETLAAGLTRFALRRATNVVPHHFEVDREARQVLNGHPAKVLWLTGFSGSGKSTIADAVERKLHSLGIRSFVLDGDNLRSGLNKDPGSPRRTVPRTMRRVAEVAHLMYDAGMVVIVALVSPFRADRQAARSLFPRVSSSKPGSIPRSRWRWSDTRVWYAKSKSGNLPNLTGVGQQYEDPESAELHLSGTDLVEQQNVDTVLRMLLPTRSTAARTAHTLSSLGSVAEECSP